MSDIAKRVAAAIRAELSRKESYSAPGDVPTYDEDELAAAAMKAYDEWEPIETVPEGERVELFLAAGEKGNGEIAIGMVFRSDDGAVDNCYWTWGGPNSGSDINERPTHWRRLRSMPDDETLLPKREGLRFIDCKAFQGYGVSYFLGPVNIQSSSDNDIASPKPVLKPHTPS